MELSNKYSINALCKEMSINRSGFYKWLGRRNNPSQRELSRSYTCREFEEYHKRYPSHGYRWLNAKIRLDNGTVYSDNYAQRCCKFAGIRSISRRCKYTKPGQKYKIYPNLLLADIDVNKPL